MKTEKPGVLCVDDEVSILNALKRLLRKEDYRLFTASNAEDGFKILSAEEVHVVLSDQRMPEMDGVTFLRKVKEAHPDIIRITLTGYTDVDSIRDAVNQGHIFKFLLKPWNDDNLILEIRQALAQYELMKTNYELNQQVMAQNDELKHLNDHLESIVMERAEDLVIRNRALELAQAILSDLPFPILGIGTDGMVVMTNCALEEMFKNAIVFQVGNAIDDYFPGKITDHLRRALSDQTYSEIEACEFRGVHFKVQCVPLSGKFRGQGLVLTFIEKES